MKTRFYFSMSDSVHFDNDPSYAKTLGITFSTWFSNWGWSVIPTFDTKVNKLLQDYIWPRFYDETLFYIDVDHDVWKTPTEPTEAEKRAAIKSKLGCIYSWLIESQERYGKLIEIYEGQEDNLMNRIGASSTTLFNDTPQNGGDFATDNHTTNATRTQSESDVATPIARLTEVRDNLTNMYKEWADEFKKFVLF